MQQYKYRTLYLAPIPFLFLILAVAGCGSAGSASSASSPGSASNAHSVTLSWGPSASPVIGYNIYRGSQSGGPYARVNSSPQQSVSYSDNAVQPGSTYFYVVTAVDTSSQESAYSNEASATIPSP